MNNNARFDAKNNNFDSISNITKHSELVFNETPIASRKPFSKRNIIFSNNYESSIASSGIYRRQSRIRRQSSDIMNSRKRVYSYGKNETTKNSTHRDYIRVDRWKKSYEHFSSSPNHFSLQLDYDYLASNSMFAIEVLPFFRKNKGDWYLTKWFKASQKWNLLTDELFQYNNEEIKKNLTISNNLSINFNVSDQQQSKPVIPYKLLHQICRTHRARVICIGNY